jgi:hypothetical protein
MKVQTAKIATVAMYCIYAAVSAFALSKALADSNNGTAPPIAISASAQTQVSSDGANVSTRSKSSCESGAPALVANRDAIDAQALALMLHEARLAAESEGRDAITLPGQFKGREETDVIKRALLGEQLAFQSRQEAFTAQIDTMKRAKALAEREIEFTQSKHTATEQHLAELHKQFDSFSHLVDKGIGLLSQKLTLQQNIMQFDGSLLDLKLAILRSKEEISKAEQSITLLQNQRRNEALLGLGQTQAQLTMLSQQAAQATAASSSSCKMSSGARVSL